MRLSYFLLMFILLIPALSGCIINFKKVHCDIISYHIIDNNGRLGVKLYYNSTDNITFKSMDASGKEIDRLFVTRRLGEVILNLSSYHTNPPDGIYKILAYDVFGNKIEEFGINIERPSLSIENVNLTWWKEGKDSYSIVEIRVYVKNSGDIPIYIDKVYVKIENISLDIKTLENVVQPGYGNVTLSLYVNSLKVKEYNLSLTMVDLDNNPLAQGTFLISPNVDLKQDRFSKSWRFGKKTYSLTVPLPEGLYNYCSSFPRLNLEDYSFYAIDPKVQGFVDMLARKLKSMYRGNDIIDFVASFAQSIEYRNESGEYPKYPIELLHDRYGDCEDKAILTSSILYKLGYDVCLIRFEDHMAVGVYLGGDSYQGKVYYTDDQGKQYIYLETSSKGWKLGEADKEYSHAMNYTIHHVTDKPILIQMCKPPVRHQIGNKDYIDLSSTVINMGNKDADNVKLRIKVEVYGSEITVAESDTIYIGEGRGEDVYIKFNTPNLEFSKMFVVVISNGREVTRSSFVFL